MRGRRRRGQKARILRRDGMCCHYCGKTVDPELPHMHPDAPSLDHKQPRAKGGAGMPHNLVTACCQCNTDKADMPYEIFLWYLDMRGLGYLRSEILAMLAALETVAVPWS